MSSVWREKALAGLAQLQEPAACVLGADTTVVLDGQILGKPVDQTDGLSMLQALSGREHQVLTAVALANQTDCVVQLVASRVQFRAITHEEAQRYWASGEPLDKAGGYAIQGLGGVFVSGLQGSYSGVVGLPLCETAQLLEAFGIPFWQESRRFSGKSGGVQAPASIASLACYFGYFCFALSPRLRISTVC